MPRWWESFGDPRLDALMQRALGENLSLKSAWSRLDQARAVARRQGAELLPDLELSGSASGSQRLGGSNRSSGESFSIGASASYELDLWGRIGSEVDAARLDAQGSAEDLAAAAVSLSARVAELWFEGGERMSQRALIDEQIAVNAQVLELVRLRFHTGKSGSADVLQQEQLIEARRGQRTQIDARIEQIEHQLAALVGTTPGGGPSVELSALPGLPPLPKIGLPLELIERRPDLRSRWLSLRSADARVAQALAERLPRLSLSLRLDSSDSGLSGLFDNWLATLAANLVLPVLDGGRREAELDRSRALTQQRLADYRQAVLDALVEVEGALVAERQRAALIGSLERQLELASTAIERLRDRYVQGATDYQRILSALLSWQQLQSTLISARLDLIGDRIALCRATAGGWITQAFPPADHEGITKP